MTTKNVRYVSGLTRWHLTHDEESRITMCGKNVPIKRPSVHYGEPTKDRCKQCLASTLP